MDNAAVSQRLKELAFADTLPEMVLSALAELGEACDFPAGQVLFREGDTHTRLYLICSGTIALDMEVPRRGQVRILSLRNGDLLGWTPIVGDPAMTATATTQEETTTVAIDGGALRQLCSSDHEIGYYIMRRVVAALSQRLLATRLQMLDLFAETTPTVVDEGG